MKRIIAILLCSILQAQCIFACSMYKLTADGQTMVGNNEDSWRLTSGIWFEKGIDGNYGACYVGYTDKTIPDGGMNEYGLVYDAFTMPHKSSIADRNPNKKDFSYGQLKTILQTCKTVDEVYVFLEKLNLQNLNGSILFPGGMLLFVDKTGKYLVVETDKLTLGNDDQFILANFSPSTTKDLITIKMPRYINGVAFVKEHGIHTDLSFCTALSDTMSVNREKVGDGTLYTSIYDVNQGIIHTYFFHDYSKRISFNLQEELNKGNHSYKFSDLFPKNEAYQIFARYKTPQNDTAIFTFLLICAVLFFLSSVIFIIYFFRNKTPNYLKICITILGLLLSYYMYILIRNQSIFYFASPYVDSYSFVTTLFFYLPILLLIAIIPLGIGVIYIFKNKSWKPFPKWLLMANVACYIILLGLFQYWKFFDIFNPQ